MQDHEPSPLVGSFQTLFESRARRVASSMDGMVSWIIKRSQALCVEAISRAEGRLRITSSCRHVLRKAWFVREVIPNVLILSLRCVALRRRVHGVHVVRTPANHAIPNQLQRQRINLRHRHSVRHYYTHHQLSALRAHIGQVLFGTSVLWSTTCFSPGTPKNVELHDITWWLLSRPKPHRPNAGHVVPSTGSLRGDPHY